MQNERGDPGSQGAGLSRQEAEDLSARILGLSKADAARVSISSGWRGFTRYAENRITSTGGSSDVSARIMSVFGQRVASVSTNRVDDPGALEAAVRRSEELAQLAPEDPEYLGELGHQEYVKVEASSDAPGPMGSEARARAATVAIGAAKKAGTVAAGYVDARVRATTLATSEGLFAHHPSTGIASTLTVRTSDGSSSGWGGDEATDPSCLDTERLVDEAVSKCLAWRGKTALEPGSYTVLLESTAFGMLMLRFLASLGARSADEGRSFFSKPGGGHRVGETLFDGRVTIQSDPGAVGAEAAPFAPDGLPLQAETWIENGTLRRLSSSRFWSRQQHNEPIARPANLVMAGGDTSREEMIAAIERGVLITRFWYVRPLNPRTLAYTGLTRDGTFLIENGQVTRPVNNFRFNQSLAEMLSRVDSLGPATRVAASENSSIGTPIVTPAVVVRDFELSSVSDAI